MRSARPARAAARRRLARRGCASSAAAAAPASQQFVGVGALTGASTMEFEPKTTLQISLSDEPGSLNQVLMRFATFDINLTHIASRPTKNDMDAYMMEIDFDGDAEHDEDVALLLRTLERSKSVKTLDVLGSREVPWFPRRASEFDAFTSKTLDAGSELESDHPGFVDEEYRDRRRMIADIAMNYKQGTGETPLPIPRVTYTDREVATWGTVLKRLKALYPQHACRQFNENMEEMQKHVGYAEDNIPQLQDISEFLHAKTGFSLRPISGLLSARNFLGALAFKVFFSTQYIRHHSRPLYTPEPDICHELMGHAPLFADPEFAQFSQEIGLASLGASDEDVERLATCYWFSVEFGLCREAGALKAYGAGCLSSFGELEHCVSDAPEVRPWDPRDACKQEYPITTYQPVYYAAESFIDARDRMKEFADSITRPFNVRYNPHTKSVEVDRNIHSGAPDAAD